MEIIYKPFIEENWLQIADHLITVLFGVASFVLAIVIYDLSIRDKLKTIAIVELHNQTKQLEKLLLNQIEPRFSVTNQTVDTFMIINIGGDCYNLKVDFLVHKDVQFENPFKNLDRYFSKMTLRNFRKDVFGNNSFVFSFEVCMVINLNKNLIQEKEPFRFLKN